MEMDLFERGDVKLLMSAILTLNSYEECQQLLVDLCTRNEIEALAQRIEVAKLLQDGCTYTSIEKVTGASTATIGRVKRFLYYGAGGYKAVLARMREGGLVF